MAVPLRKQPTSDASGSDCWIDSCVYIAAISPQQKDVDFSKLGENLYGVTKGRRNTVLHLASAVGNLPFIQKILRLKLQPDFIKKVNVNGNTALHEAAQRGHYEVVEELLLHERSLVNIRDNLKQTPLFKACEGGHSKIVQKLLEVDASKLHDKSSDGRTCLHAVVNGGHADLLIYLLEHIKNHVEPERENLLKVEDRLGNTVLHIAAARNSLDMVQRLVELEHDLSYSQNVDGETAVCVAVKQGFLPVVAELVKHSPDSIEFSSKNGKNILHLAVELSQHKTLKFLVEKMDLSQLINQPDETCPKDNNHDQDQEDGNQKSGDTPKTPSEEDGNQKSGNTSKSEEDRNRNRGDTPLHIAARNKNVYMVKLLLEVPGVMKDAVNSDGLTPLDIARKNTKYLESDKIIEKLSGYPPGRRPFLYKAPATSPQKHKEAVEIVDKVFADRRNVELVVAALLATMTFTAVFTVPGGFYTDPNKESEDLIPACLHTNSTNSTKEDCIPGVSGMNSTKEDHDSYRYVLGMPVLIRYDSFKLFLIFDCVAFYLSLFVVLMWEMSTPLTTGDKMLFMCVTSAVLCSAFAFTAYGLMAAVYSVLSSPKLLAWIVLGSSMLIAFCGTGAFFYMAAKFTVMRARFHSLCGVPRLVDDIAESSWVIAETYRILDVVRCFEGKVRGLISGEII